MRAAAPVEDGLGYRLAGSGEGWRRNGEDRVFEEVAARYPDFFDAVLDPSGIDDEPPRSDLVADVDLDVGSAASGQPP